MILRIHTLTKTGHRKENDMSGIIGVSPDMRSGVVGSKPTGSTTITKTALDFSRNTSTTSDSILNTGTGFSWTTRPDTVFIYCYITCHTNGYASSGDTTGSYLSWYFDDSTDFSATPSGANLLATDMYSGWYTTAGSARRDKHDRQTIIGGAAVSGNTSYIVQVCNRKSPSSVYAEFTVGYGYLMEVA